MTASPQKVRRIALRVNLTTSFGRSVLDGVVDYCNGEGLNWEFLTEDWGDVGVDEAASPDLVDGTLIDSLHIRNDLAFHPDIPCVHVSGGVPHPNIPSVTSDVRQVAELAARHLLDRRLPNIAVLGATQCETTEQVIEVFKARVEGRNFFHHITPQDWSERHRREQNKLLKWLQGLPKPVGIFAVSDILARRVLLGCRTLQLSIPAQVAVVGVGDYELVNKLSSPTLSSVVQAPFQIGREAARQLAALMRGERASGDILVAPKGLVVRGSTSEINNIKDPLVTQALRFIHEHLSEGIRVQDVARHVSVSRRWLEQVFQQALERSPAAEIRRVQVERATRYLLETDWNLRVIARHCGLRSPERLSILFKRETGLTPGRFRSQGEQGDASAAEEQSE